MTWRTWREAIQQALYGENGFYLRQPGPVGHFRTSVHASKIFAEAILKLILKLDHLLEEPEYLDVVDIGAGRGEFLSQLLWLAPESLQSRLRLIGIEMAPRPVTLPTEINWQNKIKADISGLIIANEWLDNVTCDVIELDEDHTPRIVEVNIHSGEQRLGPPATAAQTAWLEHWWPLHEPGDRAEIGTSRDTAWCETLSKLNTGIGIAIDYSHTLDNRPQWGTLTGYTQGRQVPPIPDGSTDITAHVAMDAVAAAGKEAGASKATMLTQRQVLQTLGIDSVFPARELATSNPAAYLRALGQLSQVKELTDLDGLGAFTWLMQTKRLPTTWCL